MKSILYILLVVSPITLQAQVNCSELLEQAIEATQKVRNSPNSTFELEAQVNVIQNDGKRSIQTFSVKSNGKKFASESNDVKMFQDESSLVVIQTNPKTVFIARPASSENQFTQALQMIDSLKKYVTVRGCEREFGTVIKGEPVFKVTYGANSKLRSAGLESITYWIHEPTKTIKKFNVRYAPKNEFQISQYEMIISKMNYGTKVIPFGGSALEKVFSGKTLRSEFRGYELLDNRQ
jgi:hypothetical protein